MHTEDYVRGKTGILLVDPYNDFLSPTGKLWPQAKEVAEEVNLLSNLKSIVGAARPVRCPDLCRSPSSLGTGRLHPLEARESQAARRG